MNFRSIGRRLKVECGATAPDFEGIRGQKMRLQLLTAVVCMLFLAGWSPAADLSVSESLIDYGTVKEGPPIIKTVLLTNNGAQPLTISNAAAS
jgi:hypothetical protein